MLLGKTRGVTLEIANLPCNNHLGCRHGEHESANAAAEPVAIERCLWQSRQVVSAKESFFLKFDVSSLTQRTCIKLLALVQRETRFESGLPANARPLYHSY